MDRVVLGELSAAEWNELRTHVRGCDACRERYNRATLAERMLHGGAAAIDRPSPLELERIGSAVLGGAAKASQSGWRSAFAWLRPSARWVTGAALLTGAAVLLPLVLRSPGAGPSVRETTPDTLQPRGGATQDRAAALRAFCVTDHTVELSSADDRCPATGALQLVVGNGGRFAKIALFGVAEGGAIEWYRSSDAPLGPEVPFGAPIPLAHHRPGRLQLYALFSDTPLSTPELEAAVRRGAGARALPIAGAAQRNLLVEITP
jgi:hypothetical protein